MGQCENCGSGADTHAIESPQGRKYGVCRPCGESIVKVEAGWLWVSADTGPIDLTPPCECGNKQNPVSQGHSYWCGRYKREF